MNNKIKTKIILVMKILKKWINRFKLITVINILKFIKN